MKRQQYLRHRLQTLSALRDAVGAMRSLAAHHFRKARQALADARRYRDEMNSIVAEIGIHQPLRAGIPGGLLVLTSDLGLCGDYNGRLARFAIAESERHDCRTVYSVGRRARTALQQHQLDLARLYDAPASLEGLPRLLGQLAQDLLEDYLAFRIGSLQVISAGFQGVGQFTPLSARILPIEPVVAARPLRRSPYVAPSRLTMAAAREFLYITLFEILLDALAAEHGMRLTAAEAALEWLESSHAATGRQLAAVRSESATQELLDIASGRRQRSRSGGFPPPPSAPVVEASSRRRPSPP